MGDTAPAAQQPGEEKAGVRLSSQGCSETKPSWTEALGKAVGESSPRTNIPGDAAVRSVLVQ